MGTGLVLDGFRRVRFSIVMNVRPSVLVYERGSDWTDFLEI